ncbi:MAG: Rrf2 family transcriptional regulator [Dehalococcoidia bacterium]|nr:MAG: Rrf2 family transcriptional regulator [Dehalococcoidia bacterium]
MKLSAGGRYGTTALVDLALHSGKEPVLLKDIARRQEIPLAYFDHIITPLLAAGIIKSTRGARGGVITTQAPEKIRLSDVIQALEGSIAPVECLNSPQFYPRSDLCVTRDLWAEVKRAMDGVLESTTLQDLVERQKHKWNLNDNGKQRVKGDYASENNEVVS